MFKKIIFVSVFLILVFVLISAKKYEKTYQEKWCKDVNGKMEVILPDKTRCDCITDINAIEFDFAQKWSEALGQSLNYGLQTGKRPGIVLILTNPNQNKYWIRLNSIILHYKLPIDTWKIEDFAKI